MASSHLWGTLVYRSALFWLDLTKDTFIDSAYSFTSFIMVSSCCRMSILLAALVRTLALPVRVSEIHLWTQAESVNKCKVVVFQKIAKFTPLIMASSSARLMCWESFAGHNQQASSTTDPSYTSDTPVARELASTHTLRAWLSAHHLPCTGSSLRTLMRTSLIMVLRGVLSILSSHPAVTSDALSAWWTPQLHKANHPREGAQPIWKYIPSRDDTRHVWDFVASSPIQRVILSPDL